MTHLADIYQFEFVHPVLRNILREIEDEFGPQTITSIYRMGDSGVHGQLPVRGTDLRCRNKDVAKVIIDWTNSNWLYDPDRPDREVAIAHGVDSNFHIHLQVHPGTKARI